MTEAEALIRVFVGERFIEMTKMREPMEGRARSDIRQSPRVRYAGVPPYLQTTPVQPLPILLLVHHVYRAILYIYSLNAKI